MLEKFKNTNFYLGWQRLLLDLKPMSWGARLEHLWCYYKEYLWMAAFVGVFVALIVNGLLTANREVLVSGMMVNISIEQQGYNYLETDYAEVLGAVKGKQVVELDYTNFSSLADPTSSEDNYNKSLVLTSRVSGGMLDYMILDQFAMEFYITQEVYLDLRDAFTQEELAELEEKGMVIYAMQEGNTERWPIALKITEIPFVQDNITSEGDIYFALSGGTRRITACRNVWQYLNAWNAGQPQTELDQ